MPDKVVDSDQVEQQVAQHQQQHLKESKASKAPKASKTTPERIKRIKSIKSIKSIKGNTWTHQKHQKHQQRQNYQKDQSIKSTKSTKCNTWNIKSPKSAHEILKTQDQRHQITEAAKGATDTLKHDEQNCTYRHVKVDELARAVGGEKTRGLPHSRSPPDSLQIF